MSSPEDAPSPRQTPFGDPAAVADALSYLAFRDEHQEELDAHLLAELSGHPIFGAIIAAMPEEVRLERNRISRELEHAAVAGDWEPYLADLRQQGDMYARMGVPYAAWSEILVLLRTAIIDFLRADASDGGHILAVTHGMGIMIDVGMSEIASAYIDRLLVETRAAEAAKEQSKRLEEVNQELQEFAYAASHDLQSPLRNVRNLATWIGDELSDDASSDARQFLDLMIGQTERMAALLDGLLSYARVGREDAEVTDHSIEELVEDLRGFLPNDRQVELTVAAGPTPLRTAAAPLRQVLRNLIGNAVHHHDGEIVKITVHAVDRGDRIEVSVMDDGPGIPPAKRERVFKMFQTLKRPDEGAGVGMGLAISRRHVVGLGGKLWIEDRGDERGCDFRFTWPRVWPGRDLAS